MANDLMELEDTDTPQTGVTTEMATTRQAQEVQAAMIVAKRFPRDEDLAGARILKACKRPGLAEAACYEYQKGGTKITGPSIRLAEVMAQNWGNLDFGFVELDRKKGRDSVGISTVQCHAWDMETNTRRAVTFSVRHWRDTRSGGHIITEEREIYELIANQAARRVRACILAIIPGDIQDAAVEQCDKTLAGQSTEPLTDRIRKMLSAFDEVGVSKQQIELKLGHATSAITHAELARLIKIYTSIRDGFGSRDDHFPVAEAARTAKSGIDEVTQQLKSKTPEQKDERRDSSNEPTSEPDPDEDERDDWTKFNDAVKAAKTLADLTQVSDYWLAKDFGPQRNTEALTIVKNRETEIRATKGKQRPLMDTSPTH